MAGNWMQSHKHIRFVDRASLKENKFFYHKTSISALVYECKNHFIGENNRLIPGIMTKLYNNLAKILDSFLFVCTGKS